MDENHVARPGVLFAPFQAPAADEARLESPVEAAKRASRHLRGTISASLQAGGTHFDAEDVQVLKFHGVCQCDNRDSRAARKRAGQDPEYCFMVRVAIPAGVLSAAQYLALDELASSCGNETLRITTRQNIQLYGVRKDHLQRLIARLQAELMTTLASCGDVARNIVAPPAPWADPIYAAVRELAQRLARELRPALHGYCEVWTGGPKVAASGDEEPFYGEQYLPRKFKVGITVAGDNTIDVYSDDCGLIAIPHRGRDARRAAALAGFNLVVGGGLGMTDGRANSAAILAQPLAFVPPDRAVEAVRTVAAIFRDYGNRRNRKRARLKHLMAQWGIANFREEFRRRVTFRIKPPVALTRPTFRDHFGPHPQHDGRWFYGVFVPQGRIADDGATAGPKLRSGLREVIRRHRPGVCLAPDQNLLLTNLAPEEPLQIEARLREFGVTPAAELTGARRHSMVCPALPSCSLALTESERVFPSLIGELEQQLQALGLNNEPIAVRMTGCPNGCARPYTADIAFVGYRPGDKYNIYVGGGLPGERLADLYAEDIALGELVPVLSPLLEEFARRRRPGEGFSDFYHRLSGRCEGASLMGKERGLPKGLSGVLP
jgi:sulfite reductase (ferredoxin)